MRQRTFWEEGVKAIPDDLNAIHDGTEDAISRLVGALSGGVTDLLFDDAPPTVGHSAPDITCDIPAQRFAVAGINEEIASPASIIFPDTPTGQHRVFFVIKRTETPGTRDVLEESGGTLSVVSDTVVVRKNTVPRIETTSSTNPLTPAPAPTLASDDIGYVEYVTIIWDGASLTVTPNSAALYSFPGAGMAYAPHAIQHLPGGGDPIQLAGVDGSPSGSRVGLMPAGSYAVLKEALQSVVIGSGSQFLQRVITGDNSPADPKRATLDLIYSESLTIIDDGGTKKLSVAFGTGPYAGSSPHVAHFDHRHPPSELPIGISSYSVDLTATHLGQMVTVPEISALGTISHIEVYWSPPGLTYPMLHCGWVDLGTSTAGIRAHRIGSNEIKLETGSLGFIKMSDPLKDYVVSVTGSITWDSADNGKVARSGKVTLLMLGER